MGFFGENEGVGAGEWAKRCREKPCVTLGQPRLPRGPVFPSASKRGRQEGAWDPGGLRLEGATPASEGASPS